MAKVKRKGTGTGDAHQDSAIQRAVSGAVEAVTGFAQAVSGSFRALVGKTSGAIRALDPEMGAIYRLAPDMIRAANWTLAPDEVDGVVQLMVDYALHEHPRWNFIRNTAERPGIVRHAISYYLREKDRARGVQDQAHLIYATSHGQCPAWMSPAAAVEYAETYAAVQRLVELMPKVQRTVFRLVAFRGLRYREVAERLGMSLKSVEKHMHKALELLRQAKQAILEGRVFVPPKERRGRKAAGGKGV